MKCACPNLVFFFFNYYYYLQEVQKHTLLFGSLTTTKLSCKCSVFGFLCGFSLTHSFFISYSFFLSLSVCIYIFACMCVLLNVSVSVDISLDLCIVLSRLPSAILTLLYTLHVSHATFSLFSHLSLSLSFFLSLCVFLSSSFYKVNCTFYLFD